MQAQCSAKQMANGTPSSHKAKDEEINNRRLRQVGEKEKINSRCNVSDTTGLRRSPREASSTKTTSNPSSTRKSERLEKRTPPTPEVRKKHERVEKQNMPSPLRRSGRNRNNSFSSPSDSKSSGSLSSKQRLKKEKSVKQLTFEAKEVTENDEHDSGTSKVKAKRMDARMYRANFKQPKKDCLEEPNRIDKSTQEGGNNGGGKIDECSRLSGPVKGSFVPSNATIYETSVAPQSVQPDCSGEEKLQMLASRNSVSDENLVKNSVGCDSGEKLIPSKRKGTMVNVDFDVSATLANDNNSNLAAEAGPSRPGSNIAGTGSPLSKQRRLYCDPTVSCYNESHNPSAIKLQDVGDSDVRMLQKECTSNLLTDVAKNICLICKGEGQLLFCGGKGCNGCYHISCLEPPLVDAPIGVWHCDSCVRKKIELGVYSVSEGIESVCGGREVPFSNVDGLTAQKEFLVKYKGLAHVHNRWVPENQLLLEAPSLLMKFNQKVQTLKSKPEWSLPHRLLQKRALNSAKQHDDHHMVNHAVDSFDCGFQWLVKWRGLDYDQVTWELDNATFFRSPVGQSLIRGYEERFQRAKRVSTCSKLEKRPDLGSSVNKLSQMPGGVSSGFGNYNFLDAVNKLREHWHKGQNAIVIDDHERILKVVAFILSLHSDIYRPFIIISTAATLHSWEDEFYRLDPSIDVVIYSGNKKIRNSIRRLEFYNEGGCILFQVLIVVPEILTEDIDVLGGIEWEAIIVDECQSHEISSYFKQIKMLNTHLRVLLFRGQLMDSIKENIDFLALLDCQSGNEKDRLISNSSNNIVRLKEMFSNHIAYICETDSFRFVEYWVPVQISHVQLEQYCATLLSNAAILSSSSKIDTVGALRDVLASTRKCCNHPYVVDPSLQVLLNKDVQVGGFLDVDIKASGKLQLLDSMLMELRKKDLRALILFQFIGGSGKDSIGDILDDFMRLRFGQDSYERIDKGLSRSKKQSAMNKFNDKGNGRFIFLLETHACHPIIKLSSVDTIIIFNSDWNPMNEIRSLQKITLDSRFELIKIFRLYSSFTIEEKALIIAKQDKILDVNFQNISPSTSHMLLMWGASYLFDDLRVLHDGETCVSSLKSWFGQPLSKVVDEFSSILSQDGEDNDSNNCSFLLKVQQNGGKYCGEFSLLGEQKLKFPDEEPPNIFWTKLLDGKEFKWKYSCSSSQRSRKKVHHVDGSVDRPDLVNEGIARKRRKVSNSIVDQPSSKYDGENLSTGMKAGMSGNPSGHLADRIPGNDVGSEKKSRLHDEQRRLHFLLKPEIAKFCEILLLPDNIKSMVDNFLEYVMNNHHVNREPVSILQAFQISLIWTAASFLQHKLDHKASLIQAKQHMNFDCKKEEVEYIYSMLRCLKKIFLYRTGNSNDTGCPKAFESSNRVHACTGVAHEVELFQKDMSKSIKEIKKRFKKKLTKVRLMQQEEKQRLKVTIENEKADFESRYKIELAFIQCCSPNNVVRAEKLKVLNGEYDKRLEELKCEHETRLKVLEDMQLAEMLKFQDREAAWVEDLKSWAKTELLNIVASSEHGNGVEYLQTCDQAEPHKGINNVDLVSDHFAEGNGHDNVVEAMASTKTGVPEANSPAVVPCSKSVDLQTPVVKHIGANEIGIMATEDRSVSSSEGHNIAENEYDSGINLISRHSHSKGQISDGTTSMTDGGDGRENFSRGSQDGCGNDSEDAAQIHEADDCNGSNNAVTENSPFCVERIADGANLSVLDGELPVRMPGSVNVSNCAENVTAVSPYVTMEHTSDEGAVDEVLDGVLSRPCGSSDPSNGSHTITLSNPPLEHQNRDGIASSIHEGQILVEVPETSHEGDVVSVLEKEVPAEMSGMVSFTDCPVNAAPVDTSPPENQLSGCGSMNVQVLDNVLSSRPCGAASPSNGPVTDPVLNQQQVSDGVADCPVIVPENSHAVAHCHNDVEPSTDAVLVSSTSDQQEGVPRTMTQCTLSQETPAISVQVTAGELQNSSQQVEVVQRLPSAELPSSNQDPSNIHLATGVEHQPINEDDLPSHDREALTAVPNQDAVQPDSNSNLNSLTPGGARTRSSDARNLSSPLEINNHNIQSATHSASRLLLALCSDPLKYELERIQVVTEQVKKNHEDMKLRLKSDFEKEYEELRRKYDNKFHEIEAEFQQTKKNLDTSLHTVLVNKMLADAFRSKCMDLKGSGTLGMHQDASFGHQLHSRQQGATRPSLVASPSCGPPAAGLQNPSTTASSQNMAAPLQPGYNTSRYLSSVSARPPLINSISSSSGSVQAVGEIRAPAPHLQPYNPSTSVPASGLPAPLHWVPSQPAPCNIPATSAYSHGPPRPHPTTYQSDPHIRRRTDSTGGFPSSNLPANAIYSCASANGQSATDLPNVPSQMLDGASLNPSRFGTSGNGRVTNSSNQAASPDLVCLSDDDSQ